MWTWLRKNLFARKFDPTLNKKQSMSRNYQLFLKDMWLACEKIQRFTKDFPRDKFFSHEEKFDAVMRNLQIIGEAVKHLPAEFRKTHQEIDWKKMSGFRDVAVHEY